MRKKILWMFLILFVASACATEPPISQVVIKPPKCRIGVSETTPLSIEGSYPAYAQLTWIASEGSIDNPHNRTIIYTAPDQPGAVNINVEVEVDGVITSSMISCDVVSTTVTDEASSPTSIEGVDIPIEQPTEGDNTEPDNIPGQSVFDEALINISITEVMADPCGAYETYDKYNEYIELYNPTEISLDVGGLWISGSTSYVGSPDKIIAWSERNPSASFGSNLITDSTIIAPGGFAIILTPKYFESTGTYRMPYLFPANTVILTIKESDRLGGENGLIGSSNPRDALVLYYGTEIFIESIISTYGTPFVGQSPSNITDDGKDSIPLFTGDCKSAIRVSKSGSDIEGNWTIGEPTPGE